MQNLAATHARMIAAMLNTNYQPGEEFSIRARLVERATTTAPARKPK